MVLQLEAKRFPGFAGNRGYWAYFDLGACCNFLLCVLFLGNCSRLVGDRIRGLVVAFSYRYLACGHGVHKNCKLQYFERARGSFAVRGSLLVYRDFAVVVGRLVGKLICFDGRNDSVGGLQQS